MKKLLTFLVAITAIAPSYAQNTYPWPSTGNMGIGTTSPSSTLQVASFSTINPAVYFYNYSPSISKGLIVEGGSNTSDFSADFRYKTGLSQLFVRGDGNIGIGTTAPDAKLTVLGTIHSKEVKVDLNVPGPDYVFATGYKLPDLGQVKSFIAEHHHLPEVPSATTMEKEGINLSEMNMKLLKKIEELTLYMIESNQKVRTLEMEISKLKHDKNYK